MNLSDEQANTTHSLISITKSVTLANSGWVGWGVGTAMTDADIVVSLMFNQGLLVKWNRTDKLITQVLWSSSATSGWTLSHRSAPSTTEPLLVGKPGSSIGTDNSGALSIVVSLSTTSPSDTSNTVTFIRPLTLPSTYVTTKQHGNLVLAINQPFIYAFSATHPGSSDQSATISPHDMNTLGASSADLSPENFSFV